MLNAMRKCRALSLPVVAILASGGHLWAQDCADLQSQLKKKVEEAQAKSKASIENRRQQLQAEVDSIKKDGPNVENNPTKSIDLDIDVTWKDEVIILNLPDVTLKNQEWILKLPEVTMRRQTWVWDKPTPIMVRQKTGQYPEFTCRNVKNDLGISLPECYTKWSDIITDVPSIRMDRTETILDVPEFSMRDQKVVVGVPEFSMREQKIVLRLPQFKVRSIRATVNEQQKRSQAAAAAATTDIQALTTDMRADIEKATVKGMSDVYSCGATQLTANRDKTLADLDKNIAAVDGSVKAAESVNAADFAKQMRETLVRLRQSRAEAVKSFETALNDINTKQRETLSEKGIQGLSSKTAAPGARMASGSILKFVHLTERQP